MGTTKPTLGAAPTREVEADGMITEQEFTEPKVVVSFERSIKVKDYETAKAFVSIQVDGVRGASPDELAGIINNRFGIAKSQAYAQLGLDSEVDPETGIVVEKLQRQFAAENVTALPAKQAAPRAASSSGSAGFSKPRLVAKKSDGKEQYWEELAANPSAFWDNRATKTGRQPDFKHKNDGTGLWVDSAPEHIVLPG
jgi:hypothetical protein